MDFIKFAESLSKINDFPLPGREAQLKMAPKMRVDALKKYEEKAKTARQAAVMALFYPDAQQETHLILILRKTYKGVHSNQVGFPGGKTEKEDIGLEQTALRETEEEIGVDATKIKVFREMTDIYIPPSNFMVYPFIGLVSELPTFIPQEDEVEGLIPVKLKDFLAERAVINETLSTSYASEVTVPAFKLNGHVVWGATAMILSELKDLLKLTL